MKDLLQTDQALYLPEGSVRALLAFAVTGAFIGGLINADVALVALSFYFAQRGVSG